MRILCTTYSADFVSVSKSLIFAKKVVLYLIDIEIRIFEFFDIERKNPHGLFRRKL